MLLTITLRPSASFLVAIIGRNSRSRTSVEVHAGCIDIGQAIESYCCLGSACGDDRVDDHPRQDARTCLLKLEVKKRTAVRSTGPIGGMQVCNRISGRCHSSQQCSGPKSGARPQTEDQACPWRPCWFHCLQTAGSTNSIAGCRRHIPGFGI
jgi:hypothetical protein